MLLKLVTKDLGRNSCVVQEVLWNKRVIFASKIHNKLFSIIFFVFELSNWKLPRIKYSKDMAPVSMRKVAALKTPETVLGSRKLPGFFQPQMSYPQNKDDHQYLTGVMERNNRATIHKVSSTVFGNYQVFNQCLFLSLLPSSRTL